MPKLIALPEKRRIALLRSGDILLHVGPYIYRLQSNLSSVDNGLAALYADFELANANDFIDYNISLSHSGLVSRLRGKVDFFFDNQRPFGSIETHNAYAFLEWGMNWCISIHANEYLKLHAAVVSKDGRAILMPGVPGAGKSTLCAALGLSGWRVLSDEHALIPPGTTDVVPLYRPVSLKNDSIQVIKNFASDAVFGPISKDTHKGIVAHLKADLEPDSHDANPLPLTSMVFPLYSKDGPQQLTRRSKTRSFILAAYHSFNYSLLGAAGFRAMETLIDATACYDLVYSDLDWAIDTLNSLHDGAIG
jgi:HprK-related kinase A